MSKHLCHAKGCKVPVPPALLMCLPHWRMVPKPLQVTVRATYRMGQEITKDPSRAYVAAADAAIAAVAEQERAARAVPAQGELFGNASAPALGGH